MPGEAVVLFLLLLFSPLPSLGGHDVIWFLCQTTSCFSSTQRQAQIHGTEDGPDTFLFSHGSLHSMFRQRSKIMLFVSSQAAQNSLAVYRTALVACAVGISVVPIPPNGSKRPACRCRTYQHRRATLRELARWFRHTPQGLALVTGVISGGLELLHFDTLDSYQTWSK